MWFSILGPLQVLDSSGEPVPSAAGNALQALASRLRRALGEGTGLFGDGFGDGGGYRLDVTPDQVDLHVFEDLAGRGRAELKAGRWERVEHSLGEALALWRGSALPDLTSHGLAEEVALRLGGVHRTAVEDLLEAQVLLGRATEALPRAEALASGDPYRERPVELLMRALAGSGRTADALADYLGLDPSPRLRRVHLDLLRGEPTPPYSEGAAVRDAPGSSSAGPVGRTREGDLGSGSDEQGAGPAPPLRLPHHLTEFVGRETEVEAAVDRLTTTRMVTLTGPGGAGKTRLATETAATLAERARSLVSGGL